jgi:hypothetical protein
MQPQFITTESKHIKITLTPDRVTLKYNNWTDTLKEDLISIAMQQWERYMQKGDIRTHRGYIRIIDNEYVTTTKHK